MTQILTLACGAYDRVSALLDGRVSVSGARIIAVPMPSEQSFPRAVSHAPFDITELSLSSQIMQVSRGNAAYVALPIFVARAFRHGCIYLRTDAGIATPRDLEGRLVGIPEYQMTLGLWLRGILADGHGVAVNQIRYRTAGTNSAGRRERLPLELPPNLDVRPLAPEKTLNDALLAGEIDAIFSPTPPNAFIAGDPRVVRLFPDPRGAATAFYRSTGFFPMMHTIGIRRDILDGAPELGGALVQAFTQAKKIALAEWQARISNSSPPTMQPFLAEDWAASESLLGPDPYPYGVAKNRAALEAMLRWSAAQHLSRGLVNLESLFPMSSLEE